MSYGMPMIAISGVALTGNMGGVAMLRTAVAQMGRLLPGARFLLLSITPGSDRHAAAPPQLKIVPARALMLVAVYMPLSVLAWPLMRFGAVRTALRVIPYFRALDDADLVLDLCGIAFVDRRGLPLLAYNVACCLPAIAMGKPIAKLSQALGPFETRVNRAVAHLVLGRCDLVVARGSRSLQYLRGLGMSEALMLPDVTFAMEITEENRADAQARLRGAGLRAAPIVVSPSEVVNRLCARGGIDFESEFSLFLARLEAAGHDVLLLPHSLSRDRSKNNDVELCRRLRARAPNGDRIRLLEVEEPALLRAIIGEADLFVGCRFHSVVGALAMGVPALIVGWSHKYMEMAEALGADRHAMDWREFSADRAMRNFEALYAERDKVRQAIASRMPAVRAAAAKNFELAAGLIGKK